MTSKITLYSDKELIKEIKIYAKERNTSVSKIVNEYFKNILEIKQKKNDDAKITNSLAGCLQGFDLDEQMYKKYIEEKYL